jgi:glycerate 2-kinase
MISSREALTSIIDAALKAVDPVTCLPPALPPRPEGVLRVIGAGKASARMARALEEAYGPPLEGLIVTRYGYGDETRYLRILEAAHPVPDRAGRDAADAILRLVQSVAPEETLICLISGGGSALLALPAPGVTLEDKQALTRTLLASGASIAEINAVRKHLSRIKGGRLVGATRAARIFTFAISDVPHDDPAVIASGPTVPDPTTLEEACAVLAKYGITPKPAIAQALADPANETPKPGAPGFARAEYRLIATARTALDAAANAAAAQGYRVIGLGSHIEGEAKDIAAQHARLAIAEARHGRRIAFLSGGELTVTGAGGHAGGRSREYALALALALARSPDAAARASGAALDTDGIDGSADAAGAIFTPETIERARKRGLSPEAALTQHRSGAFFEALGDQIKTGPTRTNVGDLRVLLLD